MQDSGGKKEPGAVSPLEPQPWKDRPKINVYYCARCGTSVVTVDRAEGTTPMFLKCVAGCPGRKVSVMYGCDQSLEPELEWFKPTLSEMKGLSPALLAHVQSGGLLLREIPRVARVGLVPMKIEALDRVKGGRKGRR